MLRELDLEADGIRSLILDDFALAIQPLANLLTRVNGPSRISGALTIGICQVLARGVSDLLAGAHLASHCYSAQAYSVMRPALEACDLLDLFAKDHSQAELWWTTDEPWKHFLPSKVRQKLGREKLDPIYDHFSERGTHPRFEGAKLGGFMYREAGQETPSAHITFGPFEPRHPNTVEPFVSAFIALGALSFRARHLHLATESIGYADWLEAEVLVMQGIVDGLVTVERELSRLTLQPPRTMLADAQRPLLEQLRRLQQGGQQLTEDELRAMQPPTP
jgi:hypothetical protein